MESRSLKDKLIVITGAGSGVGRVAAIKFTELGASVMCLGRTESRLSETVRMAKERTGNRSVFHYKCDISSSYSVQLVFSKIYSDQKRVVDILINNAAEFGTEETRLAENIGVETWQRVFDTNVLGTMYCIKEVLPGMKEKRAGDIINVSSLMSLFPYTYRAPYSASKAAINQLTKVIDAESSRYGIRINALCPGWIEGERVEEVIAKRAEAQGKSVEEVKQKTLGLYKTEILKPEDVVEEMIHLLTTRAGQSQTGQIIPLNCGMIV